MLVKLYDLDATEEKYDVCIVGGGTAGLTLASTLAKAKLNVLVLEAGGLKKTNSSQEMYRGEVVDTAVHGPTNFYRVRALGGTSLIWGGRCVPYNSIDFEKREWVPHSGWPIPFSEINRYYPAAQDLLEAGNFDYSPPGPLAQGIDNEILKTTIERFSRPTNVWQRLGGMLSSNPNVHVTLDAAVTHIQIDSNNGNSVKYLKIAGKDGQTRIIKARKYIIAAGGQESVRLLLASRDIHAHGIGNNYDLLGRFYMCHLSASLGVLSFKIPPSSVCFGYEQDPDNVYIRRRIWISEQAQRDHKLLNTIWRLNIPDLEDPSHFSAVLSLIYFGAHFSKYEYSRKYRDTRFGPKHYLQHIKNILCRPHHATNFLAYWTRRRYLDERRIPSPIFASKTNQYTLEFHSEQAPNPASRLSLANDLDFHGVPRIKLDWQVTSLDIENIKKSYQILGAQLKKEKVGVLDFSEETLERKVMSAGAYGGHHIGAARMSNGPESGVVDTNCRVHGVTNLYLLSAAVFPTSSQANPTLTIIAMTFRMAEHLIEQLTSPHRVDRSAPTPNLTA